LNGLDLSREVLLRFVERELERELERDFDLERDCENLYPPL